MAEYRIDFSIQRRHDGEDDFTEVGFGSSGAWDGLDFCTHMVAAAVSHGEWETTPGMPSPEDVIAALDGGGGVMAEQTAAEQARDAIDPGVLALARVIDPDAMSRRGTRLERALVLGAARDILASRDPAVLAALADHLATVAPDTLLDALTKAGELEEERAPVPVWGDRSGAATASSLVLSDRHPKRAIVRRATIHRLVTPWREVEP